MKKNMNRKDDYILMLLALLLLILSAGAIFWFSSSRRDSGISHSSTPKIIGKAVLTVDFGDNKERNFEGEIIEGETLFEALNQASKAGNFSYQLDKKNNLAAVDRLTRNKNKSWHWYLNGKKVDKPFGEIILKSGDKILIKYAK